MIFKRIFVLLIFVACICSRGAYAQSAESVPVVITLSERTDDLFMPPELELDLGFLDENHNGILEALEGGQLTVIIHNKGGDAGSVSVAVHPEKEYPGLHIGESSVETDISGGSETELVFPVQAGIEIPTDAVVFCVSVSESMGYGVSAALSVQTFEFQKAQFRIAGVSLFDSGKGLRALNDRPDGKLQKGEVVRTSITIQNAGIGMAENVEYEISSTDKDIYLMTDTGGGKALSGTLKDFRPGEVREISFRLSANNHYNHTDSFLPVYLTVREKYGFGDLVSANVPIPLDETPDKPVIVNVSGNLDQLIARQRSEIQNQSEFIARSAEISDISLAPAGEPLYGDAIAVVIGVEQNSYDVAPAPYAARDAEVMSAYFRNSLGIRDVVTVTDSDVTRNRLSDIFDPKVGLLMQTVKPGKTDVFVYYSGHGIPDSAGDAGEDVFLVPYDARKDLIRERGYSLNDLYASLNSLNAKSVTVILDACFSGSSRWSSVYAVENISNTKGVRIAACSSRAGLLRNHPEFRIFASSADDQTSLGYDRSGSGLFTYFLAKGMQGDADSDGDGLIFLSELVKYVTENVSSEAKKIRGGDQTPQFYGDGDFLLIKLK